MIEQRDAWWWFKLNGFLRYMIVQGATQHFASTVVLTEYPKSGGTWMSQMMSSAIGIPYPRNRLPHFGSQIIHGVFRKVHHNVDTLVVWRDGRDTMVSFYYHLTFDKPITSKHYSEELKNKLGIENPYKIKEHLPKFIEWTFSGGYPGYSWADFVHTWKGKNNQIETSYEKITENPQRELRRVLDYLGHSHISDDRLSEIVDEFSFYNQSSRQPGEEDVTSFIRKGIVGDWQNVFTKEACDVFERYAGQELIDLGYEEDASWIERQPTAD